MGNEPNAWIQGFQGLDFFCLHNSVLFALPRGHTLRMTALLGLFQLPPPPERKMTSLLPYYDVIVTNTDRILPTNPPPPGCVHP